MVLALTQEDDDAEVTCYEMTLRSKHRVRPTSSILTDFGNYDIGEDRSVNEVYQEFASQELSDDGAESPSLL